MVVPSFVRKTYLVLPRPMKKAVRFAMPRKQTVNHEVQESNFLATFDALADKTFAPMWKELQD